MRKIPAMVSMRRTADEKAEAAVPAVPEYPWGLCISLCQDDLDKLGLSDDDVSVGDMLHLHCMAKVTSVSMSDSEMSGPSRRVELQITDMVGEDEDEENVPTSAETRRSRLYG